jgi:ATP-dependent Clp protease ATP-binding subunit ClpC
MFERYTEKARRVVFFGRYEASVHGTPEIDTRCLLMGILREDRELMARLLPDSAHELCRLWTDVEALFPKSSRKIPTSVDLPLSHRAKHALTFAAEVAEKRHHECIEPRHLLWGLFEEGGPETACLKSCGLGVEAVNADLEQMAAETDLLERYAVRRIVDGLPKDRLRAAAVLLAGLAANQFETSGTGPDGPFHFSFGGKTE